MPLVQGTPPEPGLRLVDGTWLQSIAGGDNMTFQNGITAHAGGGQAAAVLLAGAALTEVDTVATTSDSVKLPAASAGTTLVLANNGASSLNVFAFDGLNVLTGTSASDTINGNSNATAFTLTTKQAAFFFCAKDGNWFAVKTA